MFALTVTKFVFSNSGNFSSKQIRQSPGLALNAHSGNEWGKIPVLTGHSSPFHPLGFRLSSPIFLPLPFSSPSVRILRQRCPMLNYYQFILENIIIGPSDVMALRYASGLFQAYLLFLSLFSPFIPKLLKGAIFRPTNIFTRLLLPPQKLAALGGRLVAKQALRSLQVGTFLYYSSVCWRSISIGNAQVQIVIHRVGLQFVPHNIILWAATNRTTY